MTDTARDEYAKAHGIRQPPEQGREYTGYENIADGSDGRRNRKCGCELRKVVIAGGVVSINRVCAGIDVFV